MPKVKIINGADYGNITITSKNDEVLYSLKDICKLFGINYQEARVKIKNGNIFEIPVKKNSKVTKKLFITSEYLNVCLILSEDEKADHIYMWLLELKERGLTILNEITIEDLKNNETARLVINRLNQLERHVSVLKTEHDEAIEKIKMVDRLLGPNKSIEFYLVPKRLKYKGLTQLQILEDLRLANIFTDNNIPYQKYIDSLHFRVVKVTTNIKAEEKTLKKVFVYDKGLKLIEEILKKKAGLK